MEKLRQGPMLHLGVKAADDDDDDDDDPVCGPPHCGPYAAAHNATTLKQSLRVFVQTYM